MKTRIVSTRIPAAQANGSFNISLPTGFGVPRGFIAYAMDNAVQPNNFDTTTSVPCISVGFGGSNIAGTGLTNVCVFLSNQDGSDPSITRAGFGNTVSVFTTNSGSTVRRQWQMTGFNTDIILGTYQSTGTQLQPLDVVFTVFSGDDFFCAVGQTAVAVSLARTTVATTFQPDAVLFSTLRPATTTDGQIHYGTALRQASLGATTVDSQIGSIWRSANSADPIDCTSFMSTTGTRNLSSSSQIMFSHMFPSGFAVTQSSANTHSIAFIAMKAGFGLSTNPSFAAGTFQSRPTASGVGTSFYSVGFKPAHILGCFSHISTLNALNSTSANGADMISYFTANGFQQKNVLGTGTITSNAANATVTGVGTSFLHQLCPLDIIYNLNYQLIGTVSSVASDTSLTLVANAAITVAGSSFVFEKPQQYSMAYGGETGQNSGTNARGRFSNSAITSFTAPTPSIQAVGNIQNFNGENGFTVDYTTLTNGGRYGWYFAIRDEDFYIRRRGRIS
jgi:hypothetical protein